jgi:hypothetical protein
MGFSDYSSALTEASSLLNDFSISAQAADLLTTLFFTYDLCKPTLSIPSQILTLNPLWNTCLPPVTAFSDPPYALSTGNGLSAFGPPGVTSSASPGPTLEPVTASVTTTSLPTPVVVQDPSVSSTTRVDSPPVLAASSIVPSSSPVVQTVKILTPAGPSPTDPSPNSADQSPATASSPAAAILSFGSSTITADQSSNFVFASETLTPGGQLTVSGTQLSLASNGGYVVFEGSTTQTLATAAQSPNKAPSAVEYIFASQTLGPNGPAITVSGTVLSLQAGGSSIVIGGTTTKAIASYLATSTPEYIIGTQTLKAGGPAITVSGTVMSLLPGASSVLVGTSTVAVGDLTGAMTTEVPGIGGIIMTIGGYGYATDTKSSATASGSGNYSNYNGTMFYGGAGKMESSKSTWVLGLSLGLGVLGACWL